MQSAAMTAPARNTIRRPRRRPAAWIAAGLLALALAGFAFETLGLRAAARRLPGQRFAVGAGHSLHLHCLGQGSPTVILEGGFASSMLIWGDLQSEAARETRVCAYDRAGLGWSDPGPRPRTGQQVAAELRELLRAAGIEGPYVLVGYSLGGLYVRQFAGLYPDDVAGLVLLESAHEAQFERLAAQAGGARLTAAARSAAAVLARFGVFRAVAPLALRLPLIQALPESMRRHLPVVASARTIHSALDENDAVRETARQVAAARAQGNAWDFPLVVITARRVTPAIAPVWVELQADLLGLSTRSSQRFAEDSSHDDILTNEPQVVLDAIVQVVREAR